MVAITRQEIVKLILQADQLAYMLTDPHERMRAICFAMSGLKARGFWGDLGDHATGRREVPDGAPLDVEVTDGLGPLFELGLDDVNG